MKKTMLALMATVGLAFIAKAVNTTGFEGYTGDFAYDKTDVGADMGDRYWVVTNTTPEDLSGTVLATYDDESAKPVEMPWAFTNTANNTYLKVDTSNEVLYRSVEAVDAVNALNAGTAIGDGLYFDANVQFTASDGEPTPAEGDKLIVWLSADDEAGTTNLVVTAATGYNAYGARQGIANYTNNNTAVSVADNEWHRLTVAAANANDMTTFKVYVDGKLVTAEGVADGNFKSLVGSGDNLNYNTLTAVGFQGTGALDNLVWTTDDPFPPEGTYALTLTGAIDYDTITVAGESLDVADEVSKNDIGVSATAVEVVLTSGTAGTVTATSSDVTVGEVVRTSETVTPEDPEEEPYDVYTYTFTVTVAPTAGETYSVALAFTADGGGSDEPVMAGDVIGSYDTEEAAAAAALAEERLVSPPEAAHLDETAATAYALYFDYTVVPNEQSGKYDVVAKLDEETLEEDVDVAVANALEAVAGDAETPTIAIPAGFYYQIEYGTTVDLASKPMTGLSTGVEVTMPELGENAGFFKVSVGTATFEE